METAGYSAIPAPTYQTTRGHIQEFRNSGVKLMLLQNFLLFPLVLFELEGRSSRRQIISLQLEGT